MNQLVTLYHPNKCSTVTLGKQIFSMALNGLQDLAQPITLHPSVIFNFKETQVLKVEFLLTL